MSSAGGGAEFSDVVRQLSLRLGSTYRLRTLESVVVPTGPLLDVATQGTVTPKLMSTHAETASTPPRYSPSSTPNMQQNMPQRLT